MTTFIKPEAGMGATVSIGSDRHAYTVLEAEQTKRGWDIKIQSDRCVAAEGHDYYGTQKYTYVGNPKGDVKRFRYFPNLETWREIRLNSKGNLVLAYSSYRLHVGERDSYSDPSF